MLFLSEDLNVRLGDPYDFPIATSRGEDLVTFIDSPAQPVAVMHQYGIKPIVADQCLVVKSAHNAKVPMEIMQKKGRIDRRALVTRTAVIQLGTSERISVQHGQLDKVDILTRPSNDGWLSQGLRLTLSCGLQFLCSLSDPSPAANTTKPSM